MDQTIYYGTNFEGKEVAVNHKERFIHTLITVESKEQRDEAMIKQVSQDLDRLASGQASVTILITESDSQLALIHSLASKYKVSIYTVDAANVTDPNDPSLIEIYKSGGIILVKFNVPEFAKEAYYEEFFRNNISFIVSRKRDELIPTFIIIDQSIGYLYKENSTHSKNGLTTLLMIGRSKFIGVTLLLGSDINLSSNTRANIYNVIEFNSEHQCIK